MRVRLDPLRRERREVMINESTCTGCTACAQACPYGRQSTWSRIESDAPMFRRSSRRGRKKKALQFGPGRPRVARARRIANKCDH